MDVLTWFSDYGHVRNQIKGAVDDCDMVAQLVAFGDARVLGRLNPRLVYQVHSMLNRATVFGS